MSRSLFATAKVGALLVLVAAGTLLASPAPTEASGTASVSAGSLHTCAVTTADELLCWGNNGSGQFGNGTTSSSNTPVTVLTSGIASVSVGGSGVGNNTCAVTTTGALLCWGDNGKGQLGDGTNTGSTTPVTVFASGIAAVAAAGNRTCALTTSGGVQCWGDNFYGQLGNGTNINSNTPVGVSGLSSGVTAISGAGDHVCALMVTGGVQCWGFNANGQLGNGTTISTNTPVVVSGLIGTVADISATGGGGVGFPGHTCARTTAGALQCWGDNSAGQLGVGAIANSSTPVTVFASGVAAIGTGGGLAGHTCAVTTGGLVCWGDTQPSADPAGVVVAVSGGVGYACAVTTAGLQCWGGNGFGNLGDGTNTDSKTPVNVVGLGTKGPTATPTPPPPTDSDGDGVPDDFEDSFGGTNIKITNPESDPPNSATVTGDAASGSTITSGDLVIELPPGTLATSELTEIEIIFVADGPAPGVNPKIEISGVVLPDGTTKTVEMPFGDQNAVCIDDRPVAEIETIDVGFCTAPRVEIEIPADGGTNTSGVYSVSRTGSTIRIEGLTHTAIATIMAAPPPVGGISLDSDLRPLPLDAPDSSGWNVGLLAGAIAAAAGIAVLGSTAWYTRRRRTR